MNKRIVLSVSEVADILSFSKDFTYTLFRRDDFPSLRLGNRLFVRVDRLEEWLEAQVKAKKERSLQ